jgi:hypothetical protein
MAALATALGFGGSLVAMRYLSNNSDASHTIVLSTTDSVLANPSPPIAESKLQPLPGPDEPKRTTADALKRSTVDDTDRSTARNSDRAQPGSDKHHSEKSGTHSNATSPSSGAIAAGASAGEAVAAPANSPRATAASSPPSAEAIAGAPSENSRPAASEPEVRGSPPPASAAKVAPVATDPVAPGAASVDPSRASVAVGAITTTGGISAGKVRVALARVPFTNCYRKALVGRTSAAPMEASLRITIDLGGRVSGAALSGDGGLPGLRSCIESEARGISVRDVDTGDGSAVVPLTFSPR